MRIASLRQEALLVKFFNHLLLSHRTHQALLIMGLKTRLSLHRCKISLLCLWIRNLKRKAQKISHSSKLSKRFLQKSSKLSRKIWVQRIWVMHNRLQQEPNPKESWKELLTWTKDSLRSHLWAMSKIWSHPRIRAKGLVSSVKMKFDRIVLLGQLLKKATKLQATKAPCRRTALNQKRVSNVLNQSRKPHKQKSGPKKQRLKQS